MRGTSRVYDHTKRRGLTHLLLVQLVLAGARSSAELQTDDRLGTPGQLYYNPPGDWQGASVATELIPESRMRSWCLSRYRQRWCGPWLRDSVTAGLGWT